MIEFLDFSKVYFLLAIIIPIIIHFFIRSRAKIEPFAAIFLLKQTLGKRNSRVRFSQFLLLLLRMCIVLLLGLAVMRPVYHGGLPLLSKLHRNPMEFIIIIDDSFSMRFGEKGQTSFDNLKSQLDTFLNLLIDGDRITFISSSENCPILGKPYQFVSSSTRHFIWNDLKSTYGCGNLYMAYKKALELIGKDNQGQSSVLILSDFQKNNSEEIISYINSSPIKVPTMLIDSSNKKEASNVFIDDINMALIGVISGSKLPLNIQIGKTGGGVIDGEFKYYINDIAKKTDNFETNSQDTISKRIEIHYNQLQFPFHLKCSISGDSFTQDNQFMAVFNQKPQFKCLFLENDHGQHFYYPMLALNPFGSTGFKDKKTLFNISKESPLDINTDQVLDSQIIFVDEGVADNFNVLLKVKKYLVNGGLVLFSFQDKSNIDFLQQLYSLDISPIENASWVEAGELKSFKVQPLDVSKKIIPLFETKEIFRTATVNNLLKIEIDQKSKAFDSILQTNDEIPFLITNKVGKGRAIFWMSSFLKNDVPFVMKGEFVPVLMNLIYHLSIDRKNPFFKRVGDFIEVEEKSTYYAIDPHGERVKLIRNLRGEYGFSAGIPGIYQLSDGQITIKEVAVNIDSREFRLDYFDLPKKIKNKNTRITFGQDILSMKEFLANRGKSFPLWRVLFWSLLGMFLFEMFIIWRIRR